MITFDNYINLFGGLSQKVLNYLEYFAKNMQNAFGTHHNISWEIFLENASYWKVGDDKTGWYNRILQFFHNKTAKFPTKLASTHEIGDDARTNQDKRISIWWTLYPVFRKWENVSDILPVVILQHK